MCSQLGKSDNDLMEKVLLGLQPAIKRYVISQNPAELHEADNAARLGESMNLLMDDKESDRSVTVMQDVIAPMKSQQANVEVRTNEMDSRQQRGMSLSEDGSAEIPTKRCQICNRTSHKASDCWFRKREVIQ